jgi:lipopolysaccharide transport system ATP-binding protein
MEDNDVLVKVEHLSKKFCKDLKTSLWYGVKDLYIHVRGNKDVRELRPEEFWAVKDINFELRRGECLGLIGHNGAGKSTLLKILNGLINPDEGKVTIKGRVGALIELGAGFNPILSGRENIYNNGAILGFTKKEIDSKVEEIIDFAEIREFIDMPVQNYSSGMKVRLGFSVASQMEPDVLIIDEVLAVGDIAFKAKCFNALEKLIDNCAVIIVSHSMPQIARICTELILMRNGTIETYERGEIASTIESYYQLVGDAVLTEIGNGSVKIQDVQINNISDNIVVVQYNQPFKLVFGLKFFKIVNRISVKITFFDVEQKPVAQLSSMNDNILIGNENLNDFITITALVDFLFLNSGKYNLHIVVRELNKRNNEGEILHLIRAACTINVKGNPYYSDAPCLIKGKWSF